MNEIKSTYNQDTGQWLENKTPLEELEFYSEHFNELNTKIANLEETINLQQVKLIELIKNRSPKADRLMDEFQDVVDRCNLYKERRQVNINHLMNIKEDFFEYIKKQMEIGAIFYSHLEKTIKDIKEEG